MKTLVIKHITKGLQVPYVLDNNVEEARKEFHLDSEEGKKQAAAALSEVSPIIEWNASQEQVMTFKDIRNFKRGHIIVHYSDNDAVSIECF